MANDTTRNALLLGAAGLGVFLFVRAQGEASGEGEGDGQGGSGDFQQFRVDDRLVDHDDQGNVIGWLTILAIDGDTFTVQPFNASGDPRGAVRDFDRAAMVSILNNPRTTLER